jgi:cytochrome c biogenesis protein CcmG/thiol:disulfide interchange protein DsbE
MARWWVNRWVRAGAVALAVASWPACNRNTTGPDIVGAAGSGGDYTRVEGEAPKTVSLDFVLKDVSGKDVRLSDLRGKPILINFWATWCGPCKLETPWFVEFTEKYKPQGLQVVGISVDDTPADIQSFMTEFKVPYTMLVGNGHEDVFRAFDAESIYPVTWIIRADGVVQAKTVGLKERDWFERQLDAAVQGAGL